MFRQAEARSGHIDVQACYEYNSKILRSLDERLCAVGHIVATGLCLSRKACGLTFLSTLSCARSEYMHTVSLSLCHRLALSLTELPVHLQRLEDVSSCLDLWSPVEIFQR